MEQLFNVWHDCAIIHSCITFEDAQFYVINHFIKDHLTEDKMNYAVQWNVGDKHINLLSDIVNSIDDKDYNRAYIRINKYLNFKKFYIYRIEPSRAKQVTPQVSSKVRKIIHNYNKLQVFK